MKRNALWLLALALAAGSVAAGCGGGDNGDNGTTTAALTKAEFLQKGNAICQTGNQEIEAAAKQSFGNSQPSADELNSFATDSVIPSVQKQIDQLRDLGAPAGDEDQVNKILDDAQAALDKGKDDPSLLTQQGGSDPFAQVNQEANAYGLTTCGQS